ncbi:MAG: putative pyridoxal-dependent aspartate 1-decarboxylase, partial [Deltaproteobacteria bacterium]|nr:putative pyridoxal-dependent aspartate 1-decarboxylase [Deltaproteobacteria bacterium]
LNILTYRICPTHLKEELAKADPDKKSRINRRLNEINTTIQRIQREAGCSFVSRTILNPPAIPEYESVVLRCVLMNPMTNMTILKEILDEQEEIYMSCFN